MNRLEEACGCLITTKPCGIVVLTHFTVREFLFSGRIQTAQKDSIRYFALSSDLVTKITLRVVLIGIRDYRGPISRLVDPNCDLYDFLILLGFDFIRRCNYRVWEWQLVPLLLSVIKPGCPHVERAADIYTAEMKQDMTQLYNTLSKYIDS